MSQTWQIIFAVITLGATFLLLAAAALYCLKKSDDPAGLLFKMLITLGCAGLGLWILKNFPSQYWPVALIIPAFPVGLMWAPNVGSFLAKPFTGIFDGGSEEYEKALYSRAEALRHKGLYNEAIKAVEAELVKFPGDFNGIMLIATLQAEDLKDLPAAQATVERLFEKSELAPTAAATALHNLADWHLNIAKDTVAARASLDRIVQSYPNTSSSHIAAQRIAHMDAGDKATQERVPIKFQVHAGERNIGLRQDIKAVDTAPDPESLAAGYVKQLESHPNDVETREKLAILYADHYGRLDLAIDQLEQLIAHPDESPKQIAGWLNLEATLQIRCAGDVPAAAKALHRVIEKYPKTAPAVKALSRLAVLDQENKEKAEARMKTLGIYEKDLGLKQAGPVKG